MSLSLLHSPHATLPGLHQPLLARVALPAVLLALVTSAPYVAGHRLDDASSRFHDALIYEKDFNSYAAYVRQAAEGAWLFRNPFTPEPHEAAFFNLEFLVTGKLAALLGLSAGGALQALRVGGIFLLCFALHRLACFVLSSPRRRLVWLLACVTGGGLGWLVWMPAVGPLMRSWGPIDRYAGLHPFFWLFFSPHFLLAGALTVLALGFYLEGESGRPRAHVWAGLTAAAVGAVRPYDALFLATVSGVCFLVFFRRSEARDGAAWSRLSMAAGALPVLAYGAWLFGTHPVFRWWGRLGVNPPPRVLSLLLGLGLVLIPFALSVARIARSGQPTRAEAVLLVAVACSLGLLYAYPLLRFSFQVVTTLLVPVALLAVSRLQTPRLSRPALAALVLAGLALNALTSVFLYKRAWREVLSGSHRTPNDFLAACGWLQRSSQPYEVVLGAEGSSNRLPRYTHDAVVAGYLYSTVDYDRKRDEMRRFFQTGSDDGFRREVLGRYGVRYVLHGPEERAVGGWDPDGSPLVAEAFAEGAVSVYRVLEDTRNDAPTRR